MDELCEKTEVLKDFHRLFFSMSRVASFPWSFVEKHLQNNNSELISEILKQTCLHILCSRFPPSVRYRRLFLSKLIKQQDAACCDPLDELYDALAEVLGTEDTTDCYKSYILPCGDAVSLQENVAMISEGTTGLVTWESALYLAEWALDHQQAFKGRTILELGSGVGLTGITICRSCSPHRYIFSDCHPSVLHKLRANVKLNGLDDQQTTPKVCVQELDWTMATEEQIREMGADMVIAADVVYDPEVVETLVTLLSNILRWSSHPEIFICSTIRNPDTYRIFKHQLEIAGINHHAMNGPVSHVFPYNRQASIEMIKLQQVKKL